MKILAIDHHELFREGLGHVLQGLPGGGGQMMGAGEFFTGLVLMERRPDLVLLEVNTPGCDGAASVKLLHQRYPLIPIVVVSSEEGVSVIKQALSYGASGYVCKSSSASTLLRALRLALDGSIYVPMQFLQRNGKPSESRNLSGDSGNTNHEKVILTKRQKQVLSLLIKGSSNKEIAEQINLTQGTVKVHVAALFQCLRVNKRTEAATVAKLMGLV